MSNMPFCTTLPCLVSATPPSAEGTIQYVASLNTNTAYKQAAVFKAARVDSNDFFVSGVAYIMVLL